MSGKLKKLGIMYELKSRKNPKKPGRELYVMFDKRKAIAPDFEINYYYVVEFFEKNNEAGNHYHKKKREIFIPILGNFQIFLEDPETKIREIYLIQEGENKALYIDSKIAHKVKSLDRSGKLLVLATSPNEDYDEFPYGIK